MEKSNKKHWISKKGIGTSLFILMVAGGVLLYFIYKGGGSDFRAAYESYARAAEAHDVAAYTPAVAGNATRDDLNRILSEILVREDLSSAERLLLARQGLELVKVLERQIDAMGSIGETVFEAIVDMEAEVPVFGNFAGETTVQEVIVLAKQRHGIVSDIRGLSYRANYHTAEILERIVRDEGVLTQSHIVFLNDQIPRVEEQFDRRSELYTTLEQAGNRMRALMTE